MTQPNQSELNELRQEVKQVTRELEALVYKAGVAGYNLERSFTDNCKEISGKGSTAQEARKRWGLPMTRLEVIKRDKLNAYGGGFELTVESEEI